MRYPNGPKRSFDIAASSMLLLLAAPVIGAVAVSIRVRLGKPVFFCQERTGRDERSFRMIKFRTMTSATDSDGDLLPDSDRLTPFGSMLRRTSLDELPELWNVVRGDMSLVGPRPLPVHYTPHFRPEERVRFSIRPGITGLAQISGRNDLAWTERFELDVEYVAGCSWRLDVRILLKTLAIAIRRTGVRVDPGSLMADFHVERQLDPPTGG